MRLSVGIFYGNVSLLVVTLIDNDRCKLSWTCKREKKKDLQRDAMR